MSGGVSEAGGYRMRVHTGFEWVSWRSLSGASIHRYVSAAGGVMMAVVHDMR